MRQEQKWGIRNSIIRLMISVAGFMVQTAWLLSLAFVLNDYSNLLERVTQLVAFVVVIALYVNEDMNTNSKIVWIIVILTLPIFGITLYLMYGRRGSVGFARRRYERVCGKLSRYVNDCERCFLNTSDCGKNYPHVSDCDKDFVHPGDCDKLLDEVAETDDRIANQMRYISWFGGFPCYRCKDIRYFENADKGLEMMLTDLKKASHFIFMEYHAIEDARAFSRVLQVLLERVNAGVEVRIIYDDVGSVGFLNPSFVKRLSRYGIQCRVFNQVIPLLNIFMQNRDHRKLTIIDGSVAYTGGYNLADEYFGITSPYGVWKDTGISFGGDGVRTMTKLFLEMWNMIRDTDEDVSQYFISGSTKDERIDFHDGYVQPYADNPLSGEHLAENVYLNMIKCAKQYVYIMTPYLIISTEMIKELSLAAKRGVDVRILTPGVPDKKMIYKTTKAYYAPLARNGVRIFEYVEGFCHGKQFLVDGEVAVIGTINLDYRSLYHHFENAVFMYHVPILSDMQKDFDDMFFVSSEVTDTYSSVKGRHYEVGQLALRFISPLL